MNRILEIGLFVLNIIALLIIWFPIFVTQPHTFEGYVVFGLRIGLAILVLSRDFAILGKGLVRRLVKKKQPINNTFRRAYCLDNHEGNL